MEKHRTLILDGHAVHYRDESSHNHHTLVLLHGFMANLDVWTSFVLSYMNHLRIITIDLPGHGHTDCFGTEHTMELMADTVKAVLDEVGVEQCVMMGHSMGGYVTCAFAERYPYMLKGMGLINSHAMADSEDARRHRYDVCHYVQENRAKYIVDFLPTLFDESRRATLERDIVDLTEQCLFTTTESIIATQQGMAARPSRIGVLQQLNVPAYFIFGQNDSRIPIEFAITQTLMPRRSESLILNNVGHMAFLEEREYIKPRILSFVQNCYR